MDQFAESVSFETPPDLQLMPVDGLAWWRGKRFWLLFLLNLGLLGLLVALRSQTVATFPFFIIDALSVLALLSAFSGAFWVSLRLPKGKNRRAWRWIGLAFLSYFIAEIIETRLALLTGSNSTPPSLANLFMLLFYPLLFVGLFSLSFPALNKGERKRLIIDSGMLACTVVGFGLMGILLPLIINSNTTSIAEKVSGAVYPLGDVLLTATLIILLLRAAESILRPMLLWMTIGAGLLLFADAASNILTLQHLSATVSPLVYPFSITGKLLLGLSAWFYLIHGSEPGPSWLWFTHIKKPTAQDPLRPWYQRYLLPYLPLLLIALLVTARELFPPLVMQFTPLMQGLALIIVLLTITRQILLNGELVDAQIANKQAQQLDALKDQFITSINHELRTPLMTMQTYIELLRYQQQQLPDKSGRLVEEIGRTNDALVDLVQSILEVRRIDQHNEAFPREAVNLQYAWEQAMALINPREGSIAERTLRVNLPADLAIWGESVRVQQILTNLLSNSIKYSPPKSVIEVSAKVIQAESGRRSRTGKQQPMVEIQVRDYGLGIPPEQIPLLFHRFVRLPRDLASNVVGSGLGLYLCQALTEAMGGDIRVESTGIPNQGSTFSLRLPFVETVPNQPKVEETIEAHRGW